jgi:hypothetical protein
MAALAFDVGALLVEQRDQQNAADSAALAGARFLPDDTATAVSRATSIASANGFQDGVNAADVVVTIGSWTPGGSFVPGVGTGGIEVSISARKPAIFAGIIGRTGWDVSSRAVAVNESSTIGPFALLSLHPTACPGLLVEGGGVVLSRGNIQVNSSCTTGSAAFRVAGTGSLDLLASGIGCNVVGGASFGGGVSQNDCNPANTGSTAIPDPYVSLADPPIPALPGAMVRWNPTTDAAWSPATAPPTGCPGSATPATVAVPRLCSFGGSFAGQTWRVFPGYYPGGVNFGAGTFLLEPGLYFIGDGGFRVANASLISVEPGDDQDDGVGGGVLIFNSNHPSASTNPGPIVLQGGTAEVHLWPLEGTGALAPYDRLVVYQDRDLSLQVEIHGGGSTSEVRGIIYAPSAHVFVRGNAGSLTIDQVIASTFEARGDAGTINVRYESDFLPQLEYAGLVE